MRDRRPTRKFAKSLANLQLFHENLQQLPENPVIKGGDLARDRPPRTKTGLKRGGGDLVGGDLSVISTYKKITRERLIQTSIRFMLEKYCLRRED